MSHLRTARQVELEKKGLCCISKSHGLKIFIEANKGIAESLYVTVKSTVKPNIAWEMYGLALPNLTTCRYMYIVFLPSASDLTKHPRFHQ